MKLGAGTGLAWMPLARRSINAKSLALGPISQSCKDQVSKKLFDLIFFFSADNMMGGLVVNANIGAGKYISVPLFVA